MDNSSSTEQASADSTSRRSFLQKAVGAASLGLVGSAFSGRARGRAERATQETRATQGTRAVFAGVAATAIETLDPLSGQSLGVQQFQLPTSVIFDSPRSAGGITESNPFSLVVAPADPAAAGAIEVWSSLPANVPADPTVPDLIPGDDVLFQYWSLQTDQSGTQFQGQLVNTHIAEAVALNLVNAPTQIAPGIPPIPFPKPMIEGTTLQGTTDGQTVQMAVQGATVDGANPFASQIQATRQS